MLQDSSSSLQWPDCFFFNEAHYDSLPPWHVLTNACLVLDTDKCSVISLNEELTSLSLMIYAMVSNVFCFTQMSKQKRCYCTIIYQEAEKVTTCSCSWSHAEERLRVSWAKLRDVVSHGKRWHFWLSASLRSQEDHALFTIRIRPWSQPILYYLVYYSVAYTWTCSWGKTYKISQFWHKFHGFFDRYMSIFWSHIYQKFEVALFNFHSMMILSHAS